MQKRLSIEYGELDCFINYTIKYTLLTGLYLKSILTPQRELSEIK
jgi:hypothetical protein